MPTGAVSRTRSLSRLETDCRLHSTTRGLRSSIRSRVRGEGSSTWVSSVLYRHEPSRYSNRHDSPRIPRATPRRSVRARGDRWDGAPGRTRVGSVAPAQHALLFRFGSRPSKDRRRLAAVPVASVRPRTATEVVYALRRSDTVSRLVEYLDRTGTLRTVSPIRNGPSFRSGYVPAASHRRRSTGNSP